MPYGVGVRQQQVVEAEQARVVARAVWSEADAVDPTEVVRGCSGIAAAASPGTARRPACRTAALSRIADQDADPGSVDAFQSSTSARSRVSIKKAPAYTRMSSCSVAFENSACQVSLEIELRVGHTRSISADRRRRTPPSSAAARATGTSPACCRTVRHLAAGSPDAGIRSSAIQRLTLFGIDLDRVGQRGRRSGRRSASLRAAADSSLTQVIPSKGHLDAPEMSTDVPQVRWSYPQLSTDARPGQLSGSR